MLIDKSSLKKEMEVVFDDGGPATVELLVGKFTAQIEDGDTYEDMRVKLHEWLDNKLKRLFEAELGLMPERLLDGEHMRQMGLFDSVDGVSAAVRDFINASAKFDGDVTLSDGHTTVKVPKP